MIRLKSGVKLTKGDVAVQAALNVGLMVVASIFDRYGFDCVITSAVDGRHSTNSKHYKGFAYDLRSKHLPDLTTKRAILRDIKAELDEEFDIILEAVGQANEHYHLEYDPH